MTKYSSVVRWSDEDEAYIAVCPELGGVSAFGESPTEALAELEIVTRLAIETYAEKGWPLPEPEAIREPSYSGQFRARLPRSQHAQLAHRAEAEGVSLNTLVVAAVAAYLGKAEIVAHHTGVLRQIQQTLQSLSGAVSSLYRPTAGETDILQSKHQDPLLRSLYADAGILTSQR
jgi:predicted RNase H-like HicB family nuclease